MSELKDVNIYRKMYLQNGTQNEVICYKENVVPADEPVSMGATASADMMLTC